MTKIRAVLFDLDGVLVDARDWHWEALNSALDLFGYTIDREAHLITFDGLPTRKKMEYLVTHSGFPSGLTEIVNELKQAITRRIIVQKCFPVFHIEFAAARLKNDGYKLAVCTNSIRDTLDLMLTQSALAKYMDITLSNEDCNNRPKPEPDIYQIAMERLGVSPEETLILEDNEFGVQAATASGAHLMKVSDPSKVIYHYICAEIARHEAM